MHILILHWGAYTHSDILQTFNKLHIHYHVFEYVFQDKNNDDFFISQFTTQLNESHYDAVFSVNYFPLVAQVCYSSNIKYLSWSYDCPLNVYNIEDTLGLETNYVFLFDRIQVKYYHNLGFTNVYHLPLAINSERLQNIIITPAEKEFYQSDISFVGKLYNSTLPALMAPFSEYTKGYLTAIANTQLKIYGHYFIDSLLTDNFLSDIQTQSGLSITKEQLAYSLATYVTHNERLILLKHLSDNYNFKLYSTDSNPLLSNIIAQGYVRYFTEMPKVFISSKINLNISVRNTQSGMPLRVLDILGCGGFLLSNYQPEVAEYFVPDTDFVYYESIEDALEKADFYLRHDNKRLEISQNGCQKCHEQFNYFRQFSFLFAISGLSL